MKTPKTTKKASAPETRMNYGMFVKGNQTGWRGSDKPPFVNEKLWEKATALAFQKRPIIEVYNELIAAQEAAQS